MIPCLICKKHFTGIFWVQLGFAICKTCWDENFPGIDEKALSIQKIINMLCDLLHEFDYESDCIDE
jgi:hypothetical protein